MNVLKKIGQSLRAEGVDLVTIPNVPIIATGIEYPLSTGPATFTEEDLADAVRAAEEDPNVQHPRIKLAYGGPHTDAVINEPAFGKVVNLRLGNNNQTIYGDIAGVPKWLAEVLPVAYPARSIEGNFNCETVGGNKYRLIIHCVSLLGVHVPGVTSLPDLAAYFGSSMPEAVVIDSPIQASGDLAAAVNIEDVRRNYYESLKPEQAWWWIRAMELEEDGGYLVVDDDEGNLYKVGFNINEEEVSFAESQQVKIKYEDVPKEKMAASVVAGMAGVNDQMTVYASRAESRPTTATKEGGVDLDSKALAKRLGLPEDATEEQINAKIDEGLKGETQDPPAADPPAADPPAAPDETTEAPGSHPGGPAPAGPPAPDPTPAEPATDDEGFVKMDKETYERLAASGEAAMKVVAESKKLHREQVVAAAIKAGKIAPASRENFLRLYEQDEEQTEKLLTAEADKGGLAAGLIPVDERGNGGGSDTNEEAEGLPTDWFGGAIEASKKRAETPRHVTFAREA